MQGADPRMAGGIAVIVDPRAVPVVTVGVEQHRAEAGGPRTADVDHDRVADVGDPIRPARRARRARG